MVKEIVGHNFALEPEYAYLVDKYKLETAYPWDYSSLDRPAALFLDGLCEKLESVYKFTKKKAITAAKMRHTRYVEEFLVDAEFGINLKASEIVLPKENLVLRTYGMPQLLQPREKVEEYALVYEQWEKFEVKEPIWQALGVTFLITGPGSLMIYHAPLSWAAGSLVIGGGFLGLDGCDNHYNDKYFRQMCSFNVQKKEGNEALEYLIKKHQK